MSISMHIPFIKKEIKENLSISLPLVSSQLIYACSGFIGTAMVARLGEDALAASVLVSMIWMSLSVLFFGMLNSVSVLVSHQFGAKDYQKISEIIGQAFILGVALIIIMGIILSSMPLFLRFTTQPPQVIALAMDYMYAMLWTIPGLILLIILENFLTGINRPKIVLRISLMIVPIEIPLIYLLIFGKFGLPECGVAGIGYGFATTYTVTAIGMVIYLLKSKQYQAFGIFKSISKVDMAWIKELVRVGLPMGLMHVIEVSAFTVATFWVAQFGTALLAAHQIVMQYLSFIITIVFGMSQAVTVRVGHAVGRQNLTEVRYAIYTGMGLNAVLMLIAALALIAIPEFFLRLDMNIHDPKNAVLLRDSALLLAISGVLILFDNFRIIGFGALRGLKDTKFPMYASLIAFWLIGLSVTYLFAFPFKWEGAGIWWGLTVGIASGALIVFLRIQTILRRVNLAELLERK